MSKIKVYFFQFNFSYGNEFTLPYSSGMLWAYANTYEEVRRNCENKGLIFLREDTNTIVSRLITPQIAAFSTYTWNWEMSIEVSKKIKEKYPQCLIIFGGPQVPDNMNGFFEKYPFIDITVHGEGEITFAEILKEHIGNKQYATIKGLTFNGRVKGVKPFERREVLEDINILPSPYLEGLFDEILNLPFSFQPIWETNRGCPYPCSYCDWGSSVVKKIRLFNMDRIYKEIQWFGEKRINFVYGADANFGILRRDVEIAKALAETKEKTGGFPARFRVSYTKNSTQRVVEIAEILNAQKMDKGITLSVQSMNEQTLKAIKRKNLPIKSLSHFVQYYNKRGIPTYTELILGLPGETYDSFKAGINMLLEAGFHNSLSIYNCSVLPNAHTNNPQYKEYWKIKTKRVPVFLNHAVPDADPIPEYEEIIIQTKTLPTVDWKKQCLFSWVIQTFHSLNLTQVIAVYFNAIEKIAYSDFYEELLIFAKENLGTIIGNELTITTNKVDKVLEGEGWGTVLKEFSDISWSLEQASYLRIAKNFNIFYLEIKQFIEKFCKKYGLIINTNLLENLLLYQKSIVVKWNENGSQVFKMDYSLHDFYRAQVIGESTPLKQGKFILTITDDLNYNGDKKTYAKEIMWWGRKGGKFIYQNIKEESCGDRI